MSTTDAADHPGPSRGESSDSVALIEDRRSPGAFHSILFADRSLGREAIDEPECFGDLHLDQIVAAAIVDREEYQLDPFFRHPLIDSAAVAYRHDVVRDLGRPVVWSAVTEFADAMRRTSRELALSGELHHPLQKQRCLLEAVSMYRDATKRFAERLEDEPVISHGLAALRSYLAAYITSSAFTTLDESTRSLRDELGAVRYTIQVKGANVRVGLYDDQDDLAADVEETFARFRQGAVEDHRVGFRKRNDIDHVEAQILERVANLYPETFASLRGFCVRYENCFDETIVRFDREVQFYLAYLEQIAPIQARGLSFCLPEVIADGHAVHAREAFDLSLAVRLGEAGAPVITNDFELTGAERVLVVTGPNQGGKTTFARMFGQLHYLASLGLPVPGSEARLLLPDRMFTHFEREESVATLRGKFEDELVRIHEILEQATARSILVMNESFGSTTLRDALVVGGEIVGQIIELGALCVFVTFVDELADVGPQTVSMMSNVESDDPTRRTYKIRRRPADGLAYATALAAKYGLAYDALRRRVRR
jgi:DNA mismatch repair protein MutS